MECFNRERDGCVDYNDVVGCSASELEMECLNRFCSTMIIVIEAVAYCH